jgi:hypothetical protein
MLDKLFYYIKNASGYIGENVSVRTQDDYTEFRLSFGSFTSGSLWPRYFLRGTRIPLAIRNWGPGSNFGTRIRIENNELLDCDASVPKFQAAERNLNLEQAAEKITLEILSNLPIQPSTKLYTTGGLDTAALESIINNQQLDIEIDRTLHRTQRMPQWANRGIERRFLADYHPDLRQIPPTNGWLMTGHWGGVEMGRWPGIARTYAHLDGWDYDQELERYRGSYLYNFLKSPLHRAADPNKYPGTKVTTDQEALDVATNILYHSHEVRDFDQTKLVTPFRNHNIHQIVHQLRPDLLLDNAFTSSLHMAVIEVNDPTVFDTVVSPKFKTPFG